MSSTAHQTVAVVSLVVPAVRTVNALVADVDGQDLVEYALLCMLVALVGIATWGLIERGLGNAYTSYDTAQQTLWEPADPTAPPSTP